VAVAACIGPDGATSATAKIRNACWNCAAGKLPSVSIGGGRIRKRVENTPMPNVHGGSGDEPRKLVKP
jgi:hypothetical protein